MADKDKLWVLEAREKKTDNLINRWEPMSEKRANALKLLLVMGDIKEGVYLQVVPDREEKDDG